MKTMHISRECKSVSNDENNKGVSKETIEKMTD